MQKYPRTTRRQLASHRILIDRQGQALFFGSLAELSYGDKNH